MNKIGAFFIGIAILFMGFSSLWADPPHLETDKSVDPTVIYLPGGGDPDETTVTLTVRALGDPDIQTYPIDIALVMDRSSSMEGQKLDDAKIAAMYFCTLLDYNLDQSSLVSFANCASLDQELTSDHYLTILAINGLVAWGNTAIGAGIMVAQQELTSTRHRRESQPVMVLLSDGDNNLPPDPIYEANSAKAQGTIIYTIGLGIGANESLLKEIASDPDSEYYYYAPSSADLDSIYESVHENISTLVARKTLSTEILAQDIHYVPGSYSIPPISISGDTAMWDLGDLHIGDIWSVTFDITASDTGHLPVDDYPKADVTFLNYLGETDSVPFPQAYIDVLAPGTGVSEDVERKEGSAVSLKARPNPFSNLSTIHYSIPHSTKVTLNLYSLTGNLIRTLIDENEPAGTNVVDWDRKDNLGKKVSSGVYILRLKAGNLTSTQKIVLLR